MAVFDIGLLEHFLVIFPFLLVWVIVFGVLSSTKTFGDNKGIHSVVALVLAFLFITSKDAVAAVNYAAPWFVLLFLFIIFIILAFKAFGASNKDVIGVMKNPEYAYVSTWIAVLSVVIIIAALSNVHGQKLLEEGIDGETTISVGDGSVGSEDFEGNVWNTIFHPKVLGLLVMLIIGSFTIRYMAQKT